MSATEMQTTQTETESERVERWRTEALEKAGYDAESARALAKRHEVDLHRAIALIEQGCPAETAIRILL